MLAKHERYYGLDMNAMLTVCSRNTNVIIVWAWMAERSRTALCCPATKHCEYGHKMVSGSLASAQNPTPVSKIELLQPPRNRAVTPGWREEPVRRVPRSQTDMSSARGEYLPATMRVNPDCRLLFML